MIGGGFLHEGQRLKFGVQRAVLVSALTISLGGGLALIAWATRFPDLALRNTGKLMETREQAVLDSRVRLAGNREDILVQVARTIASDDDKDPFAAKKTRLAALNPFFTGAKAEREAKRPTLDFSTLSPVTVVQDPITGREIALNGTSTGTVDPRAMAAFCSQAESISALVALANQRARSEAPVDARAIVERDLAELLAAKK